MSWRHRPRGTSAYRARLADWRHQAEIFALLIVKLLMFLFTIPRGDV